MENWLTKRAMLTPNRMAVRFEDTTLTFAEMRQRVLTIAGQITQHIDGNERIALITPNNLTGYLMILAIQQLGKTVVLLNRRLSPREMAFQLDDAEITTVIQDDRFRLTGNGGFNQLVLFVHVIVVRGDKGGVAQLLCLRRRAVGFSLEERVVV